MTNKSIQFLILTVGLTGFFPPSWAAEQAEETAPSKAPVAEEEAAQPDGESDQQKGEEPGEESQEKTWYEEVVVTASRTDQKAKDVPVHTTVILREDVLIAPETGMSDIVRQITSLNLAGDQDSLVANHRDQSLNFRGVSGSRVSHGLLLVDGIPLLDPYNASANWTKVAKDYVDRVEVVSGGGANIWGNLALSGVVNLITRAPSDGRLTAKVRGGSKQTQDLSLSYSDIAGPWAGWIAGNYFDTNGYITLAPEDRGLIDEPEFKQYQSLIGRGDYTVSQNSVIHLGGLAYSEDRGEGTAIERATNEEYSLTGAWDHVGDQGGNWNLRIFGRDLFHEDNNSQAAADRNTQEPRSHIFDLASPSAGMGGVWTLPGWTKNSLTMGADTVISSIDRNEDLDWDGQQFTRRSEVEGKQRLAGVFLEDRFTPSERWSIKLAGRFDVIRTYDGRSITTDLETGDTVRADLLKDNTETTFNPNIGFVYAASPSSRFRAAAYTGFRAPMPSELFVGPASLSNRVTLPNPALEPESLIGAEAGYDYTHSSKFNARFTGFWSETEDLIQLLTLGRVGPDGGIVDPCGFVGPNGSCRQRRNVGKSQAYGAELNGEYRPTSRLRFIAGATLLKAEITANPDDPDLVGNRIPSTPDQRVILSMNYFHPRLFDSLLRYRYVGDKFDDPENEDFLPSYQVVDFSLSRTFTKSWTVFGGVQNVFDKTYAVSVSSAGTRIGAPRLFHIGFRYASR